MIIHSLIKKRKTRVGVITRVQNYVMLFNQASNDISEIEIRDRLRKAAIAFEDIQAQLEEHEKDEQSRMKS